MHVVWVTNEAGADPRAGGGIRSQRLVAALARVMAVDVVALGAGLDTEAYLRRTGATSAASFDPVRRGRYATVAQALLQRLPLPATRWHAPDAETRIKALLTPESVLVIEHGILFGYRPAGVPFVLSLQNVDSLLLRELRNASAAERFWNSKMLGRIERRATTGADSLVVVVSERDAGLLPGKPVVVPNGADSPPFVAPLRDDGSVLFIGSMGYPPNEDAVRWWVSEIWPLTSSRRPLTVVGAATGQVLADLADHPGVRLVGEVADVGPFLAEAALVAIPLRMGGGTRLKVLEALSWGRPLVTTSKGAEGIPLVQGRDALFADSPGAFAARVDELLVDRRLADALATQGKQFASAYEWSRVTPTFVDAVEQFIGSVIGSD